MTVSVEAAARLHFGVLDLRGTNGRWFGGIGAGAPGPTLLVEASLGEEARGLRLQAEERLLVTGEDADRAREFARRFLAHHGLPAAARIHVARALPAHAGLGSGTQLALSVARALAELHGIDADAPSLARTVGRGRRSAVGTWTFAGGGLVVEGGRRPDRDEGGPLIARLPFPPEWHCVVGVPFRASSMNGAAEETAFAVLPPPSDADVQRVAHLVLGHLLPALGEGDLQDFGAALSEIQETTGRWWAPVQGGAFAAGISAHLVDVMRAAGAAGVGQSSWGPTVYGIVSGAAESARVAEIVRRDLGDQGVVYEGPFRADGARVLHH